MLTTDPLAGAHVRLGDAPSPAFFAPSLEFSAPARGTWNIVHTGMLLPESQQIYVGAIGCLRGVVLTAAEMGCLDRFSSVIVEERDLLNGHMEDLIVDGVSDVLTRLPHLPRAVMLFPTCLHHFLGTDLRECYRRLRVRWPQVGFGECFMDPAMRKRPFMYDHRLRRELYRFLPDVPKSRRVINIIGNNLPTQEATELYQLAARAGLEIRDLTRCHTWDEYLLMAEAGLNIYFNPLASYAVKALERRLGTPWLYLPVSYDPDEICATLERFAVALDFPTPDFSDARAQVRAAWQETAELLGDTPLALDATFTWRPFSLARFLTSQGLRVTRIYADAVSPDDRPDFDQLRATHPDIELYSMFHASMRQAECATAPNVLALGQKAAYYTGTRHFVPSVETGGLYGLYGLVQLAAQVRDAYAHAQDPEPVLRRKAWGCSCVLPTD